MKLKPIEKLCKASGCVRLYDEDEKKPGMSGCILRGLIYPYKIGEQLVETLGAVYNAAGVAAEQEQMKI